MSAAEMLAGAAPRRVPDWHSIDWRKVWQTVRRLQARIVKAIAQGRWNKVKALVYLLTHSYSGRALAILRVVSNSGAKTPGVDGVLWNTPEAKSAAFSTLRRHGYQPQPCAGCTFPKATTSDQSGDSHNARSGHASTVLAGTRSHRGNPGRWPFLWLSAGRRCADALAQTHGVMSHRHGPQWILEGDIKACFDSAS